MVASLLLCEDRGVSILQSHPSAKCAYGWGTRLLWKGRALPRAMPTLSDDKTVGEDGAPGLW
jgi:hypothetical protein